MLTTLLESRAVRPRNASTTIASILLHAAVVAAAAAATIPGRGEASLAPPAVKRVRWISVPHPPAAPAVPAPPARRADMRPPGTWVVVPPTAVLDHLPPIEVGGPVMPEEQIRIGGPGGIVGPTITGSPIGGPIEGIRDVGSVDKVPSVLGNPPVPRYPNALRESGIAGRVVVRFVIDTLGRAELDGVAFVESTHPLFADAVRQALGLFRFTPGEATGRKVRTMVQLPFTFTLR